MHGFLTFAASKFTFFSDAFSTAKLRKPLSVN